MKYEEEYSIANHKWRAKSNQELRTFVMIALKAKRNTNTAPVSPVAFGGISTSEYNFDLHLTT